METIDLPIHSKIFKHIYVKPFVLWFFFNFIAICACCPADKKDVYHFEVLFYIVLCSSIFIFILSFIFIKTRMSLTITTNAIICLFPFSKKKIELPLVDITDFEWNNKAVSSRTRYGNSVRLKNEYISIYFTNNRNLTISFDQYENFDDIKKFIYNYCIMNQIINIRPLAERKKSIFLRRRNERI